MAVNLSPVFNDTQFKSDGTLASGYKIYTYAEGSSTLLATYTTSTGTVPQANPIVLNSRGEVDNLIWLTAGLGYKLVYTDANGVVIRTENNIRGVNDATVSVDQWLSSGLTPTYVSATSFTLAGDQTTAFHIGRRLKSSVTAGTAYSTISNSVFGALTTVTVVNDSGSALDSGMSAVSYGLLTNTNDSIPTIVKTPPDSAFRIVGSSDSTKKLAFEVDTNITTATTVTHTPQNLSGTVALVESLMFPISAAVATNAMTLTLNPCAIAFRSATLGSGTVSVLPVNTAITTVISSGSTGGSTSTNLSRIMVLAINNAGTVELAWCNAGGASNLDEGTLISTTAEGGAGAADSADVIYSTTARTNVAFRIVGYVESTQATAGTWVTSPSTIQGMGGFTSALAQTSVLMTSQATTSGTTKDFTIPSWAKEIVLNFQGVSTNSTSSLLVQIGDAGGIETSSYVGVSETTAFSTGFNLTGSSVAAAGIYSGTVILSLQNPSTNTWNALCQTGRSDTPTVFSGAGYKSLSQPLTTVRFTTVSADTFDLGSVSVTYRA